MDKKSYEKLFKRIYNKEDRELCENAFKDPNVLNFINFVYACIKRLIFERHSRSDMLKNGIVEFLNDTLGFDDDITNDCLEIQKEFKEYEIYITLYDSFILWEEVSEESFASWMDVPKDDHIICWLTSTYMRNRINEELKRRNLNGTGKAEY